MIEPWDRAGWRLGLMWGRSFEPRGQYIGYAALKLSPSVPLAAGTETLAADHVDQIVERWRAQCAERGEQGEIGLYVYTTERAFADSRAAAEGLDRATHAARIRALREALRQRGVPVTIQEISR